MVLKRLKQVEKGSRVVWLRGPPCSGKTPVAKSVALSLDRENHLAASFFFDKTGRRRGAASLECFVMTLAAQLAERNPWYRSALAKITFGTPSIIDEPPASQLGPLLIDPLQAIYKIRPDSIPESFIVIDGLGEGGTPEDVDELMELVTRLEGLPRPFRIFLSSRSSFPDKDTSSPSPPLTVAINGISDLSSSLHNGLMSPTIVGTRSRTRPKTCRPWDVHGEAIAGLLEGHTDSVRSVSFSPDGKHIVSGSYDSTVRIWDAALGQAIGEPLRGHTDSVRSVSFSPDGKRIVSGSVDDTIRIWDAELREAIGEPLRGHTDSVWSVSFSPEGKRIVSGSWDGTLRIWDAESGEAIGAPLRGHTSAVDSVSFSPDGKRIISGSGDKTVRIWDAGSGEAIGQPLRGHTSLVTSVSFSPDGKHIFSGSYDKTVRIWDPLLTLSFLDSLS